MFVPLHDGVPMRHLRGPYATHAIILGCCLLHLMLATLLPPGREHAVAAGFGLIPAVLFGAVTLPADLAQAPAWATLFTALFIHASFVHLIGNMLFLWVFGDNVEDAMGHGRFILFFLACGVSGSLSHAFFSSASAQPLVGASGAIAGVIAAYVILYPRVRIWGLAFKFVPLKIPAYWAIAAWLGLQVVQAWLARDSSIGWFAHLGGFAAGLVLTPMLARPGLPLFGQRKTHAG